MFVDFYSTHYLCTILFSNIYYSMIKKSYILSLFFVVLAIGPLTNVFFFNDRIFTFAGKTLYEIKFFFVKKEAFKMNIKRIHFIYIIYFIIFLLLLSLPILKNPKPTKCLRFNINDVFKSFSIYNILLLKTFKKFKEHR